MGEVNILKEQLKLMAKRIEFLEDNLIKNQKEIIKEALEEFTNQKKDPLKNELMRKFNKNKKEIIKQKIVDTLKIKSMDLSDLKYYIVDQLNYCSKASFYRYVEELKDCIEIKKGVAHFINKVLV